MSLRDTANLGDIFQPEAAAEKLALIDCRDWAAPIEISYGDLDAQADACARGLLAKGFEPGDAIAILSSNRAEFITAFMGILRAGMTAVPANFKFPAETLKFIFEDASVRAVIGDDRFDPAVAGDLPVFDFDDAGPDGYAALLDPGPFETADPGPDGIAMVLYTSGSTGRPKGVPLTHAGHLWAHNFRVERSPDSEFHRLLVAAPLYHMNALCVSLFAFGIGATIVLLPEFTAERYVHAIERFKCTWITSVPTMLAMCFSDPELTANADLTSVKVVRMGSAPVSPKLWGRVQTAFPEASIMNGYGTTEAGPVVFGPKPGQLPPPLSVGWPSPGVRLKLVDGAGNEADEGDLWHLTPAIMPGYLNLPEKTKEAFSEDGLYKSGDVFRRDAETGAYFFVGRVDDMFNCGGENIYPAEVEATLVAHPKIEMACVVPVPDEIKGMKPVAFVVPVAGETLTEQEVKQYALDNAPAFRHPRMVTFLDDLPLAGPGKVDRNGLEARARQIWEQSPDAKAG